jgi:hypothetical protein
MADILYAMTPDETPAVEPLIEAAENSVLQAR